MIYITINGSRYRIDAEGNLVEMGPVKPVVSIPIPDLQDIPDARDSPGQEGKRGTRNSEVDAGSQGDTVSSDDE